MRDRRYAYILSTSDDGAYGGYRPLNDSKTRYLDLTRRRQYYYYYYNVVNRDALPQPSFIIFPSISRILITVGPTSVRPSVSSPRTATLLIKVVSSSSACLHNKLISRALQVAIGRTHNDIMSTHLSMRISVLKYYQGSRINICANEISCLWASYSLCTTCRLVTSVL